MKRSPLKRISHWMEWLLVKWGFAFFSLLPMHTASNIGACVTRMIGPHLKVSQVAKRNLQAAFPDWSEEKITQTVIGVWDNVGRYATEFPHVASMTRDDFFRKVEVIGEEYLRATEGTGALFYSCHIANWELGIKMAAMFDLPVSAVYRPLNNPMVDTLINSYRNQYQVRGLTKTTTGGREMIRELKAGNKVAILIDQKMNTGIPVPFLGRDCMTTTSIADLAIKYGYPILPVQVERIGRSANFRITISPPLEFTLSGDYKSDALMIMTMAHARMEDWIRQNPEQWFWLHKRWG